ncbi:MAG: EAL domain-containing protein [Gammaproteobacteria bacterium]|nr:EAL domain-containing protein [Gammaproteobacteria bacterium]MBT6670318.1 EAL domain-containing protein [Gammaproteobacteria bacterium]MBT8007997.1 EAL domain-containing protein [Gammaproteobacteria bacterium]
MSEEINLQESNILVVDDDPVFVGVLTKSLGYAGYKNITSLNNPLSALELLKELDFDLLLLDQCMPEMSGIEVLQNLSQVPLYERPAVLMVTGETQTQLPEQALSQGAWDLVTKPIDLDTLLLRIHNLLQLKVYHKKLESENQLLLQAMNLQKQFKGQQLSLVDSVTELPSKMIFMDRLEQAIINSQKLATGVGILRLQSPYETLQQSHEWLREMTSSLSELVGHKNMLRNSHHSFLVMLDLIRDQGDIELILSDIKCCEERCFDQIKLGVVVGWKGEKSAAALLKEAEMELPEQQPEEGVLSLKALLYQAIFEESGEAFELVWQPQVAVFSRQVVSAEVLLRWNSEVLGLVPPSRFIPIAEAEGWIGAISQMVLERALQQYQALQEQHNLVLSYFSVNLSASDLKDEGLFDFVADRLEYYQISPSKLCIELTESELMKDLAQGKKVLNQFRKLGIKVALDDFGTGYSSLSYLRLFEVDILKLDRSFITDLADNSPSQTIIQALSEMANMMNIEMVVEGVEEQQQRRILLKCGVNLIQGFYYSKPLSLSAFVGFLQQDLQHQPDLAHSSQSEVSVIEWSAERFGIGHKEIDQQHQMLFKIINRLVAAIEHGNAEAQLQSILNEMQEYAEFHLLSEEMVLNDAQYLYSKEHHDKHELVRRGIQQLVDYQYTLHPVQAYQYLKEIWIGHILNEDREFSDYI